MMGFVKKNWFLFLITASAVLLLFLWIQGRSRERKEDLPDLPVISYPKLPGQSVLTSTQVTFVSTVLPTQMAVYKTSPRAMTPLQAKVLAKTFGFPEEPSNISQDATFGDYYLWLSGSQSLSIRLSPLDISLGQDPSLASPPTEGDLPSEQTGIDFVKNVLTLNDLDVSGVDFAFEKTVSVFNDSLLEVSADPTFDKIKIVDTNPKTPLVSAYLGKDGKIYGLIYRSGFTTPVMQVPYPLKNLEEIKNAFVVEGKMLSLGEASETPLLLVPSQISIELIELGLLYSPENPTALLPVYTLDGKARTEAGEVPVYIYIPAVKSRYVNK